MDPQTNVSEKRALILEDDYSQRTLLRRILKSAAPAMEIEWVSSAEEALPKIRECLATRQNAFDIIVADIFLDGSITGIDFWQTCQRMCPETAVLLISSMPTDYFVKAIGSMSPPPYLSKPFHLTECRRIIDQMLSDPHGPHQQQRPPS